MAPFGRSQALGGNGCRIPLRSEGSHHARHRQHHPRPATGAQTPRWTTGQGIGFLAALPGLLLIAAAAVTAAATTDLKGDDLDTAQGAFAVMGALGLIMALPGVVVFLMCRTRRPR